MTGKPPTPLAPRQNPDTFEVYSDSGENTSQALARISTDGTSTAATLKTYTGCGDALNVNDLVKAMRAAGDEAVRGDFSRIERALAAQALTLNAMFDNLARRAYSQETLRGAETLTRLALKCQAQARSTAETLSVLKNPTPFLRQTNIAHGNQQVNVSAPAHAGNSQLTQNEVLEQHHGERLDTRTTAATGRGNQTLEAMGAKHRPTKPRGKATGEPQR